MLCDNSLQLFASLTMTPVLVVARMTRMCRN
jgi:hypothetical protein